MATSTQLLAVYRELEKKIGEIDLRQGGPSGPRGPIGPKGRKGEKGPTGPKGPAGATGATGAAGKAGKAGKDGRQGPKGEQGPQGLSGAAGANGIDGREGTDGVSITNAEVDFDGHLTVHLSDGSEIDAGKVTAEDSNGDTIVYSGGGGGGGGITILPNDPETGLPPEGSAKTPLWYNCESPNSGLYYWFDDGDSQQWVPVSAASQGPAGPQGEEGPVGPQGAATIIQGNVPDWQPENIPLNPESGDLWILNDPLGAPNRIYDGSPAAAGDGMIWDGTVWFNGGPIRGADGPPGEDGPEGPDGPVGPQGPQGFAGVHTYVQDEDPQSSELIFTNVGACSVIHTNFGGGGNRIVADDLDYYELEINSVGTPEWFPDLSTPEDWTQGSIRLVNDTGSADNLSLVGFDNAKQGKIELVAGDTYTWKAWLLGGTNSFLIQSNIRGYDGPNGLLRDNNQIAIDATGGWQYMELAFVPQADSTWVNWQLRLITAQPGTAFQVGPCCIEEGDTTGQPMIPNVFDQQSTSLMPPGLTIAQQPDRTDIAGTGTLTTPPITIFSGGIAVAELSSVPPFASYADQYNQIWNRQGVAHNPNSGQLPVLGDHWITVTEPKQHLVWDGTEWVGSSSNAADVLETQLMDAASYDSQQPLGLGQALQITFGPPQAVPSFSLGVNGDFTCLIDDEYNLALRLVVGRTGGAGESQVYARTLVDGVQVGASIHTIVDNARIEMPLTLYGVINMTAGQVLTFEIIRDSDGNDSGGLEPGNPDVLGWNPAPSARLQISHTALEP